MPIRDAEVQHLLKEIDGLRTEIVRLRHELTNKTQYAERLEVLLRERMERIDELTAKLEQAREQNRKLEAEAEHLCQMLAAKSTEPQRGAQHAVD